MAKIGQMALSQGRWNGQQVVPAAWVAESIAPHAAVDPDPTCGWHYGYFWWLASGCAVTPKTPWYMAAGNGGQRIVVVPSRDMVIVVTAGNYNAPNQSKIATSVLTSVLAAIPAP